MYKVVYTKGNNETVIAEFATLEESKVKAKELNGLSEYCTGLITVEKDGRIY